MTLLQVNQEANKVSMSNEVLANDVGMMIFFFFFFFLSLALLLKFPSFDSLEFQKAKTTSLNLMSLWYHSIGKNGKLVFWDRCSLFFFFFFSLFFLVLFYCRILRLGNFLE
jgi:hypothetical protein